MKKTYIIRTTSPFNGNREYELKTSFDINEMLNYMLDKYETVVEIIEK